MASRVVYKLSKMHSFEALVAKHVVFSQPFHPSTRPTNSSRRAVRKATSTSTRLALVQ